MFFIVYYVGATYVILNLYVAVILENFQPSEAELKEAKERLEAVTTGQHFLRCKRSAVLRAGRIAKMWSQKAMAVSYLRSQGLLVDNGAPKGGLRHNGKQETELRSSFGERARYNMQSLMSQELQDSSEHAAAKANNSRRRRVSAPAMGEYVDKMLKTDDGLLHISDEMVSHLLNRMELQARKHYENVVHPLTGRKFDRTSTFKKLHASVRFSPLSKAKVVPVNGTSSENDNQAKDSLSSQKKKSRPLMYGGIHRVPHDVLLRLGKRLSELRSPSFVRQESVRIAPSSKWRHCFRVRALKNTTLN